MHEIHDFRSFVGGDLEILMLKLLNLRNTWINFTITLDHLKFSFSTCLFDYFDYYSCMTYVQFYISHVITTILPCLFLRVMFVYINKEGHTVRTQYYFFT